MGVADSGTAFLVVNARGRTCALPMADVAETMRPLPLDPLPNMPIFVCGLSIIRGQPIPVLDLGILIGATEPLSCNRFVTVHCDHHQVALALDAVLGVHLIDTRKLSALPPLMQGSNAELVQALGALDRRLMVVLRAARLLSQELKDHFEQISAIPTMSV